MSSKSLIATLSVLVSLSGCATKLPDPIGRTPVGEFPAGLVIAVRNPNRSEVESDEYEVARVVEALLMTGLFRRVSLTEDLDEPFDLEIEVIPDSFSNLETNEMMLLSMFTLGVFPAYGELSQSVRFKTICGSSLKFEFDYRTTEFGGWLSLFVLPSSRWRWGLSDRDSYWGEQVAAYLRSRANDIASARAACKVSGVFDDRRELLPSKRAV